MSEIPRLLSELLPYKLSVTANNLLKEEKTMLLLPLKAAAAFCANWSHPWSLLTLLCMHKGSPLYALPSSALDSHINLPYPATKLIP